MRRNSDSHLDDIAKRFAATAPTRPKPDEASSAPSDTRSGNFNDETAEPATRRSRKATAIIVVIALAALAAVVMIALVLMRA